MKREMLCICLASALALAGAQTDAKLIDPGKRLGKLSIGDLIDDLKWLKKSDYGDAAMGHSWQTWEAKKPDPRNGKIINSLDVYAAINEAGKSAIRLIRSTSPTFSTKTKIKVGSSYSEVLQKYPGLKKVSSYGSTQFASRVAIYDDSALGIGFEFKAAKDGVVSPQDKCVAVWVHEQKINLLQESYPPIQYLIAKPGIRDAMKHGKAKPPEG